MPRATRTRNVTQEHQEAATTEGRPRKVRASKKEAECSSDTRPIGPEQGRNKGPEGPEEGRAFPHLTTMPLQSWGERQRANPSVNRTACATVELFRANPSVNRTARAALPNGLEF
jgi:hypothetical protein